MFFNNMDLNIQLLTNSVDYPYPIKTVHFRASFEYTFRILGILFEYLR